MAHFAEIDGDNKVLRVIVINDADCLKDGIEDEQTGIDFCHDLLGGTWKQTSYNHTIRKHFAGIGFTYDADKDAFIPPQPYPSWTLDNDCNWQPPTPIPDFDYTYRWDENNLEWVIIGA